MKLSLTDTSKEKPESELKNRLFGECAKIPSCKPASLIVQVHMMNDYFISYQESDLKNFDSYIHTLIWKME